MMDSLDAQTKSESGPIDTEGYRDIIHTFKKISHKSEISPEYESQNPDSNEQQRVRESSFSMHSGLDYSQSIIQLTQEEENRIEERYRDCNVFNTYSSVRKKIRNEKVVVKGSGVVEKIVKSGVSGDSGTDITILKSGFGGNSYLRR